MLVQLSSKEGHLETAVMARHQLPFKIFYFFDFSSLPTQAGNKVL